MEKHTVPTWARIVAGLAFVFGLLTVRSGGGVIFTEAGRQAAGDYVPFVVWFNFLAGFAYLLAGIGLWSWRRWAAKLSLLIAISTLIVFAAFGVHVVTGGAFEMRTVGAMILRSVFWLAVAAASCRALDCGLRRREPE